MLLLALIALTAGCRDAEVVEVESAQPAIAIATPNKRAEQTHSVAAETAMSDSPAANSFGTDAATESPEAVCRAFMKRLQNGDRISAENLLTRAALTTTHRANLTLEPISGPDATMSILPARYASQLERNAQVDCEIVETVDGAAVPVTLTWQVVRQSNGWRVCGMVVPLGNGQDRLLSFESIDDVATIKMLAAGEEMAESAERHQFRQADSNESRTSLQ